MVPEVESKATVREIKRQLQEFRQNPVQNCELAEESLEEVEMSPGLTRILEDLGVRTIGEFVHVHGILLQGRLPRVGERTRVEIKAKIQGIRSHVRWENLL